MKYILSLILFCFSSGLYAQEYEQLLAIIELPIAQIEKQQKIDSFLLLNESRLNQSVLADCYHDLGSKWYYPNSIKISGGLNLEKAISYTSKSLAIKRKLNNLEDCSINKTLNNLGFFHFLNYDIYEAIDAYKELEENGHIYCSDRKNGKDKVRWSQQQLTKIYKILGNYYAALDICDRMLNIYYDAIYTADISVLIATEAHILRAETYFLIDPIEHNDKIIKNLDKAVSFNKPSASRYEKNIARILNLRANCQFIAEDFQAALITYSSVLDYFSETDSLNKAVIYSNKGYCLNKLGSYDDAEVALSQAIDLNPLNGDAFNNLGDLKLANGDFFRSMVFYNKAIALEINKELKTPYFEIPSIKQLESAVNKTSLLNHMVTKANAWLTWYEHEPDTSHLEHALETFDLADQLVDLIRFESTEQQSKLFWREKGASLYSKAVEVCYLLDKPERAFYFMERNKALLLLEDLGHEEAKRIAGLPVAAAQQEFKLRRQIFLAENDLIEADTHQHIEDLRNSVRRAKTQYEAYIDSLNTAYPDYARYKRKTDIITFDKLRSKYLLPDQYVLHYIVNEEDGYGLLNTTASSQLFRFENIEPFNKDIKTYMSLLSNGTSDLDTFYDLSYKLYQQLFPEEIRDRLQGKQLLIVPDYNLQRIPFETLVTDISGLHYLIEDAEISYAYSLSLLERQSINTREFDASVIAMAPVKFGSDGLGTLRYSEDEAVAISDLFQGDLYIREQASKANFTRDASGHKIIHLATHADLGDGENPWIAFSDGKMYLKEIYATPTQSEMVVLSACNTSQGDLKPGEGIMSLARGFFYSGANSVVSSLWPITDKGGRDIMQSFYKNLNEGHTKSAALRKAKLDYLHNTEVPELKHPYYWAGFVVLGDNAPLVEAGSVYWFLVVLALTVGLIFLGIHRLSKFGK